MTTNDIDAAALMLNQTYFALDAQGFAVFQDLIDKPPSAAAGLRRTRNVSMTLRHHGS